MVIERALTIEAPESPEQMKTPELPVAENNEDQSATNRRPRQRAADTAPKQAERGVEKQDEPAREEADQKV